MSTGALANKSQQKSARAIALPAPPPPRSLNYVVALETGSEQFQKTVQECNWPKRKIPLCSLNCRLCGASCKPHFCFLHELHVQFTQIYEKLMRCTCKSCKAEKRNCRSRVYMKHYQNGKSKNIMVFSALASSTKHRPSFKNKTRLCSKKNSR